MIGVLFLFLELLAGFSIGRRNAQEAAPRRGADPSTASRFPSPFRGGNWQASALGAVNFQKPLRGVYFADWENFAHRSRRKTPARAPHYLLLTGSG